MRSRHVHKNKGVTLIEAMVAIVIVAVLALGGLTYQAYGAAHFRIAKAELTATRAGQLLIEDWKGNGSPDIVNYDATELGVGFVKPNLGDNSYYTITVDGITLYITLSFADVAVDNDSGVILRQLNVKVQWSRTGSTVQAGDPSITLSTYARLGQD